MANKEFKDSLEATEFMEHIHDLLNDERLKDWADATDDNYSATTSQTLAIVVDKYNDFVNQMYDAGE